MPSQDGPGKVVVVGLGPGDPGLITLAAAEAMNEAETLLVRTVFHPALAYLESRGLLWEGLDRFYETGESFAHVYSSIADYVVDRAETRHVCYAVPGDPWVGETTTKLIKERCASKGIEFSVISGVSFFEPLFAAADADPFSGMTVIDATDCSVGLVTPWSDMLVCQVYNKMVASDVKLMLLENYPGEHTVKVISGAGSSRPVVQHIPLYELDHESTHLDHLTSLYVPKIPGYMPGVSGAQGGQLPRLTQVMERLRGDNGCPWDAEQTHDTLKPYVIEEAFEVLEAIESGSLDKLCEELGDLLLQVVFHARVAEEAGGFTMNDVITTIVEKLIRRHPHVFGDVVVQGSKDVLVNWEKIKRGEKGNEDRKSILDGVPVHLPALLKADKLQSKAAKVGFDWDKPEDALLKVWEEAGEFKEAWASGSIDRIEDEMGDLLFAIVNVARLKDLDAEFALRRTMDKFQARFRHIEARAAEQGRSLDDMSLEEMDIFWNEAKTLSPVIR